MIFAFGDKLRPYMAEEYHHATSKFDTPFFLGGATEGFLEPAHRGANV